MNDQKIMSKKECKDLDLDPIRIELSDFQNVEIPQFLYTQSIENDTNGFKCLILIEVNQEDTS